MGISKDTTIFLDQYLGHDDAGDDILGTEVAEGLWKRGYRKIHLATADLSIKEAPLWISSIRDKSFPTLMDVNGEGLAFF